MTITQLNNANRIKSLATMHRPKPIQNFPFLYFIIQISYVFHLFKKKPFIAHKLLRRQSHGNIIVSHLLTRPQRTFRSCVLFTLANTKLLLCSSTIYALVLVIRLWRHVEIHTSQEYWSRTHRGVQEPTGPMKPTETEEFWLVLVSFEELRFSGRPRILKTDFYRFGCRSSKILARLEPTDRSILNKQTIYLWHFYLLGPPT